ncbi:MAG: thiamine-phosphate kinase, partial [Bacteroidales bacterium]|nr:thiamine-phosphate kinase [Bacteroidales bacterium]
MSDKDKKPEEQAYGKYVLIKKLKEKFAHNILPDEKADKLLVSTSVLLEGIHFNMVYFPLKHLGYKSVINSIAGIYSKAGKPENLFINLGLSSRYKVEDIEEIFEGFDFACNNYDLKIAEINVDSSLTGLTLSITSTGDYNTALKSPANPSQTDIICVTGNLGGAYMGLQLLERERKVFEETKGAQPQLEGFEYVIGRQ